MTPASILRPMLFVLVLSSHAFTQEAKSDGHPQLEKLCDEFASVRLHFDMESAEKLILPSAHAFFDDGRLGRGLLKRLKQLAADKEKKEADPDRSWNAKPLRVLHRDIKVNGSVASVTELLGATAPAPEGTKVKPLRRTMTWLQVSDASEYAWKVASLHESPYSAWEKSITAYEEKDKVTRFAAGGIVFVGSSSIRGWKSLAEDFSGFPVLGRGFGGSQLIDSTMYAHRIVLPYRPSAVAVYAGDNDIASGKSPDQVFQDFQQLVETLHAADPKIRIGFIAIKPSIRRWGMWPQMKQANTMISDWAGSVDRVTFLDIGTPMLGQGGKPKPELFVKDGLHLSRAGYELWTSVVMPWAKAE